MLSKFRIPEIALGALIATAAFAIGIVFYSSRHPPQQSEQQSSAEHSAKKTDNISDAEKADDRIARYTLWLAVLTGGLVLMAGIQGYFLLRSDKTARTAADAAKLSAEAAKASADMVPNVERAYVFIKTMIAKRHAGHPHMVDIHFHNYGRTPANVAKLAACVRVLDHIPTDADIPGDQQPGQEIEIIIGADKPWVMDNLTCHEDVREPREGNELQQGKTHIYCWGMLEYRDIFGKTNPTNFCRRLNMKDGKFYPVGGFDRNKGS
jgi:hypothetical protein